MRAVRTIGVTAVLGALLVPLVLFVAPTAGAEPEDPPAPGDIVPPGEALPAGDLLPVEVPAETLATVTVTARKWREDPRVVPQSVTVVDERTLRDAALRSVGEAALRIPNLQVVEFSSRRLSFPFVRGIGSGQGDPAVATYVDGVPQISINSTNLPLLDVERIEFLRGPRGTLYGRNALGGLIHVVTRRPPARTAFAVGVTLGSHRLRETRLKIGTPVVPGRLSFSAAGLHTRREGFTVNDVTGRDVDHRDTLFGRAQLFWTPDRRNEVRFSVHGERTRDGGFVISDLAGLRARPHRIRQDFEGFTHRDVAAPSITWSRKGARFDLTSITAYNHSDVLETSDIDFSPLDGIRRRAKESVAAFTQEVRISSPARTAAGTGGRRRVRWLLGALYFTAESERVAASEFRPGGVPIFSPVPGTDTDRGDFDDHGVSVFGQATVSLGDRLEVGAGLRYDYESRRAVLQRSFVSGGVTLASSAEAVSETFDQVLPRFDVAWRCADGVTVYGIVARGFKAGGFNLDAPAGRIAFTPETSWTFEGGVKATLLDDRLTVNAAAFAIDWDDMQLSQYDPAVGGYVTNAGASTSRGVEVEVTATPVPCLDVFGAFGFTDTEFESYVDPYGVDVAGNDLPFAPSTTWSAGAQVRGHLGRGVTFRLRAEHVRVGEFHYDAGNRESERYALTHVLVGVGGRRWRLDGWVRNAFDEEYVPLAFQPSPLDPSVFVGESGAPRTYGITLSLDL